MSFNLNLQDQPILRLKNIKARRDNVVCKTWYVTDPGVIPGITYGSPAKNKNKIKKKKIERKKKEKEKK